MKISMDYEFKIGNPYFVLSFADRNFKLPIVTSLVFLGKDIEIEKGENELWFFQDSESYAKSGDYRTANKSKGNKFQVYDFNRDSLRDVLTLQGLVEELTKQTGSE